jgi:hypothetical protein
MKGVRSLLVERTLDSPRLSHGYINGKPLSVVEFMEIIDSEPVLCVERYSP